METMSAGQDVQRNENASPKGDEGVLSLNLASKVVEKAEKSIAVTLSGGDSPALKEQTEYKGNDVNEISLNDIAASNNELKESSKSERTEIETTVPVADDRNGGGNENDFPVVIGGKLAHRYEVDSQTVEMVEEDFDIIEDLEELLDEQVETFIKRIILDQVQQNDGTLSPEEIEAAMCESASDFEIIDADEGRDRGASDAAVDEDVVNPSQVIPGWKVLGSDGLLRNLERSASDQHADEEVEEIMDALAAAEAADQVHQSREWRALGSYELADIEDPSSYYPSDPEGDIDYDSVVCQACMRGIEQCTCANFEADRSQKKKPIDEVLQLPKFDVNAPGNLEDSCDGDVEDSCSQPDDMEFGSGSRAQRQSHTHKGPKSGKNPPSFATVRPQPRRPARSGNQPSKAKDGRDTHDHDSDSVDEERLQKMKQTESCLGAIKKACATAAILAEPEQEEGNVDGRRNSHSKPARGPMIKKQWHQQEKHRSVPKSKNQQRKQKKHVNKYILKLQKAAENGDLVAAAELTTFEFKVETEIKDVGFGDEVILHMPLLQLREYAKVQSQRAAHECEDYWNQVVVKEKRRLADAFADIYVKNASIKKLNAELDKADRMISGNARLIDQLEAEVKQLRESKRLRSFNKKKQKQRQRDEQGNQPRTGSDDHKARKSRDQ